MPGTRPEWPAVVLCHGSGCTCCGGLAAARRDAPRVVALAWAALPTRGQISHRELRNGCAVGAEREIAADGVYMCSEVQRRDEEEEERRR